MKAIELSTGHVFAEGCVTAVSPLFMVQGHTPMFKVIGVGFCVEVYGDGFRTEAKAAHESVRQEAISKLIGGAQ